MIESQEVELKLELSPGEIEAFRHAPVLGDPARRPVDQLTTYYDTDKGELRKAGYSLRLRRKGKSCHQTVKQRGADSGGFSSRAEWETKVDEPELDFEALKATPVGKLLTRKDMRKRLAAVSETQVRRTTWLIALGASEIELILDEGRVVSDGREAPISEIELELKRGARGDLFALAQMLGEGLTLRMGVMSKSERGFRLLEDRSSRAHKAEKVRLDPAMTIGEAFAVIVQSCLRHFRLNEPLVAGDMNASALHQARVAMRRLRSALTLFRPVLVDSDLPRLRSELRWFTSQLGDARNLDVMLATGPQDAARPDPALRRQLRRQRKHAYERVQRALAERRLPALILDLVAWSEAGGWRSGEAAGQPIGAFAEARLDRAWKRVRQQGKGLAELPVEDRHRLRIEMKKLRYATEFFASLAPGKSRGRQKLFTGHLRDLQELLGDLNDIETRRQLAPQLFEDGDGALEEQMAGLIARAGQTYDSMRELGPYWR
ncbi:MAG TPA: CHAD domain-containing protein [Allosphingosinicella sp.]|nr:CHAD domain-containing protein [Allosphingosinicella sp.]